MAKIPVKLPEDFNPKNPKPEHLEMVGTSKVLTVNLNQNEQKDYSQYCHRNVCYLIRATHKELQRKKVGDVIVYRSSSSEESSSDE